MTSGVAEVRSRLEAYFCEAFQHPESAAVAWPNVDFSPDVIWDPDDPMRSMFFAVSHQIDSRASASFGNGDGKGRVRLRGAFVVQIFAVADTGTGHSMDAARKILDAFDGVTLTTDSGYRLQMQVGNASPIGPSGGYWQTNVELPWYCDEIANVVETVTADEEPAQTFAPEPATIIVDLPIDIP